LTQWIDFKQLRARLNFRDVLASHKIEINAKGTQHHGYCPLPGHQGKRNSPSFSANLEKGIFQCFGCQARGNILDFAALMAGENPKDAKALRKVALALSEKFGLSDTRPAPAAPAKTEMKEDPPKENLPVVVNAPLGFALKGLDPAHPYLLGRGFTSATISHFGLGFCGRGLLKDRVAIPLHNERGDLVGYAGRIADEKAISADVPKYKFPSDRVHEGKLMEFKKLSLLYNATGTGIVSQRVGDIALGHDECFARQADDALVGATVRGRRQSPRRMAQVDADDGEVAICKFPDVRTTSQCNRSRAVCVGVRAKSFEKGRD